MPKMMSLFLHEGSPELDWIRLTMNNKDFVIIEEDICKDNFERIKDIFLKKGTTLSLETHKGSLQVFYLKMEDLDEVDILLMRMFCNPFWRYPLGL